MIQRLFLKFQKLPISTHGKPSSTVSNLAPICQTGSGRSWLIRVCFRELRRRVVRQFEHSVRCVGVVAEVAALVAVVDSRKLLPSLAATRVRSAEALEVVSGRTDCHPAWSVLACHVSPVSIKIGHLTREIADAAARAGLFFSQPTKNLSTFSYSIRPFFVLSGRLNTGDVSRL